MNAINRLTELFRRFPSIGPRQAERFVSFLLRQSPTFRRELAEALTALQHEASTCSSCMRFYSQRKSEKLCGTCSNSSRNEKLLMVVEKDVDLDTVERSGSYDGYYFVLGGLLPILEERPHEKIRINELTKKLNSSTYEEIILALSANTDGDYTTDYVVESLEKEFPKKTFQLTRLGRGLSTGSELEYIDPETIKNALNNRA